MLELLIRSLAKKSLHMRGDDLPTAPYYYPWTWENLEYEPFSFVSGKWKLRGFRYWKKGIGQPKAQVTFFHGVGSGQYAYTSLINMVAQAGYLVYAYDNVGSGISEGTAIDSLSYAAINQRDFYRFLDEDPKAQGLKRYSIGHSWGGFAALVSLLPEYRVEKVVSIAGFDSVAGIYADTVPALKKLQGPLKRAQRLSFGDLGLVSGLELMKQTSAKVLYIQGDKDVAVPYKSNGKVFQEALKDKPNISFIIRPGMQHNPYWTKQVEDYTKTLFNPKNGMGTTNWDPDTKVDHAALRSLDPEIEKAIIDFYGE